MKYVCYCMTRNLYRMVIPSLKSLLNYNDIDKVFLIAEDDDIGVWLPNNVEIINVSEQKWFNPAGPNYNTKYTYMALMRIALPFILPNVDRILSLDLDTIVAQNLDELWKLPMDNYYLAGVPEVKLSKEKGCNYINFGVLMMNLDKFRDGTASRLIKLLNEKEYLYPEQDCVNEEIPEEQKLVLSHAYNMSIFSGHEMVVPKIIHFAAYGAERFKEQDIVCKWGEADWGDVLS